MTSIVVHSANFYLSNRDVTWRDSDYQSHSIVKSYKDEEWKYYVNIPFVSSKRLTFQDRELIRSKVNPRLGQRIRGNISSEVYIVPVPDSAAFVGSGDEGRAFRLSRELASEVGHLAEPCVALRWRCPRTPQHVQSGMRRMTQYLGQLSLVEVPSRPVVLVDDMITSGSQMLACANILEAAGCVVLFGVVVGKRALNQVADPLSWDVEVFQQDEQRSLFAE